MTTKSRCVMRTGVWSASAVLAAAAGTALTPVALAGPEGAQVVRGDVRFERNGQHTVIRAGDRSIINYQSFNIGALETVRFIQPSAESRVLNRIQGAAPTRIDGGLSSNGRVYIVNPAGVIFGNSAVVNVGGLFAAAGNMSNSDFVRGIDRVTGMAGTVENGGSISAAPGGSVVLTGGSVMNSGNIVAPGGTVAFAAGEGMIVGSRGSNVYVQVSGEAATSAAGAAVSNTGTVDASGGRVIMAAGDIVGMAISTRGAVRAGDVAIEGRGTGNVVVSGTVDASNQRLVPGQRMSGGRSAWMASRAPSTASSAFGGSVRIVGENVALASATVDASGRYGGGQVEVGGGAHGAGDIRAQVTAVNSGSTIRADATERGDGGSVAIWSDHTTRTYADISARGGVQGGNGGFIETSGKEHLTVDGSGIDASARGAGSGGMWLMDPRNVTVTANPATPDGDFTNDNPSIFTPSADDSNVFAGDIESRLNLGTSVTITTGTTGTQDGDITITTDITSNSAAGTPTLRFEAANSIIMDNDADITAAVGTSLNVDLVANTGADNPDPTEGAVKIVNGSSIVTNGGDIRIGGGSGQFASLGSPTESGYAAAVEASGARGTSADRAGVLLDNAVLDAGTGSVDIRGVGLRAGDSSGVAMTNGASIAGGDVQVHGVGGSTATGDNNAGVVVSAGSTITVSTGELRVQGLGRGVEDGYGVHVQGSLTTSADGTIDVRGASGGTGDAGHGVFIEGGAIGSANAASVAVTGTGAGTTQTDGVRLEDGASIFADAGNASLTVTGSGSGVQGVGLAVEGSSTSTIGGANPTVVTVVANTVSLPQATFTGSQAFEIRPFTTGNSIGVGTGANGTLRLTDAVLALLNGYATVTFGGPTTGIIRTAALDFSSLATDYTFHGNGLETQGISVGTAQTLTINMDGAVTQTGAISAGNLLLSGSGAMTLTHAGNDVDVLAGATTGTVRYSDADGFQVGSISGTDGFTSTGALELRALTGTLDVAQAITFGSGGASLLGDEVDLGAMVSGPGDLYIAPVSVASDVRVGHAADAGAGLDLTSGELANISGTTLLAIGLTGGNGTLTVPEAYTFDRYTVLRMGGAGGIVDVQADVRSTGGGLGLFGRTNRIGGDIIATGGDIVIDGDARLTTDVLVDATDGGAAAAGGNIQFRDRIDADAQVNGRALTITNGASGVTLGNVGENDALASLTVNAQAITLADVRTVGSQNYNGPTTLDGNLASITSGGIVFQSTLTLAGDSTIESGGGVDDAVVFRGAVSGNNDLTVTTGDGDTILFADVSGDEVRFEDRVVLERDITVNGTTSVTFEERVDSFANEANDLTVNSPDTTFGGLVGAGADGALGALRTDSTGVTNIDAEEIIAQNGIRLLDTVVLGVDSVITSNSGLVEFGQDVQSDGFPRDLEVSGPGGVFFREGLGFDSSLATLTVSGPATLGGNATTTGAQNYQALTLAADVTINAGSLTIAGTLNSDSASTPRDLIVATGAGATVFGGAIGGTAVLDTLEVTSNDISLGDSSTRGGQRFAGDTELSGDVRSTTSGPITFAGDLLITTDVTIASAGDAGSDDVNFQGRVDSDEEPHNLTVSAGQGDVLFSEPVGTLSSAFAINTLNVSGASVALRNVRTAGSQVYTGVTTLNGSLTTTGPGAIAIGGALTLQSDASITTAQGDVVFGGTVNSDNTARALTVNTGNGGTTRFVSAVGNNLRLASLTTNSDGTTRLEGGQVRTTGDQTYNDNVVLGTNVTMEGNDITFGALLNSDNVSTPRNLTLNSSVNPGTSSDSGETVFSNIVGGQARLGLLTTNTEGTTRIADSVFTSRGVNLQDGVLIAGSNITIDGAGGPLTFRSSINADTSTTDPNLVLISSAAGDADNPAFRFGSNIGNAKRLGSLAIGSDRTTARAGSIVFSDAIDSQGRIVKANVALTDAFTVTTGNGGFSVGGGHKITALGSLTITSSGAARFGDVTALNNLTVNAASIALRRRTSSQVQTPTSGNFNASIGDSGSDIVTGGSVNFNVRPTFEGTGGVFAYSTGSRQQDPELAGIIYREPLTAINVNNFDDPRNAQFLLGLDLIASGPSSTQIAPAILTNPVPIGAPPEDLARASLPTDIVQSLAEIGVDVRSRGTAHIIDGMSGRNFETDLPASVGPEGLTWQVGAERIDEAAARGVVDEYRALMFTTQDGPDGPVLVNRADVIRQTLSASWDRYAAEVRLTSGAGWRAWLDSMGSTGSDEDRKAREFLIRLQRIAMGLEDMGLAPDEARPAINRTLGMVRPPQISAGDFEQAVRGTVTLSAR